MLVGAYVRNISTSGTTLYHTIVNGRSLGYITFLLHVTGERRPLEEYLGYYAGGVVGY